jgi:hypothetical protein
MGRRIMTIAPVFLALALAVSADDLLSSYLGPQTAAALRSAEEIRGSFGGDAPPRFVPQVPRRADILESVRALGPTLGVEVLAVFAGDAPLDTPEARLELYNLLNAVSRMKGLQYYSASRRRLRTLFAESYTIDDPVSRNRIPDPVFSGAIPPENRAYLFQEDLTFGATVYRSAYYYDEQTLSLHTSNLTTMRYLGIPMIKEGASLTWIVLAPLEGKLLFYGLTCGKTASLLGLEKSKAREDSFYYRLKAIFGWYTAEIGERF